MTDPLARDPRRLARAEYRLWRLTVPASVANRMGARIRTAIDAGDEADLWACIEAMDLESDAWLREPVERAPQLALAGLEA